MPRLALALLLLVGCRPAPEGPAPLHAPDALRATWPVQVALDPTVSDDTLAGLSRWIGAGDAAWLPPASGSTPSVAARAHREDTVAIQLIAWVGLAATCRLGREPGALDGVPRAAELATASCAAVDPAVTQTPPPLPVGGLSAQLAPAHSAVVELHGQRLTYRFLHPGLLDSPLLVADEPGDSLVDRVRTRRWGSGPAAPISDTTLAGLEQLAEREVAGWQANLAALPDLESSLRGVVLGWVRGAVYGDLGAAVLDSDPATAQVLLEEAAGGVPRPRPGPGRDPVLLARVAMARWRAGEVSRAAELLRDVSGQPGWEFAGIAAEMAARVAVLPSATDPRVRR